MNDMEIPRATLPRPTPEIEAEFGARQVAIAIGRFILVLAYRRTAPPLEAAESWLRRFAGIVEAPRERLPG